MAAGEPPLQELPLDQGWIDPALRDEFKGLGLRYTIVEGRTGRSPRPLKQRLRYLSDRIHGERVLNLRREPVAAAYRIFFRQVGIDPDEFRPPAEAAMLERLRAGRFESHDLVEDALTVAIVETGVAVRALDAGRLSGSLGLRLTGTEERLGAGPGGEPRGTGPVLPEGTIVLADERTAVGLIFGETAAGYEVTKDTRLIALCAVVVGGVPEISVEEALWASAGIVTAG
jgi:DNA/RNA-binding domain of Phe-tRNA-synthetase-like protein